MTDMIKGEPLGMFKLKDEAILPTYGSEYSACFDLRACLTEDTVIKVHNGNREYKIKTYIQDDESIAFDIFGDFTALIPTGLVFCMSPDYHMKIYSRSGNAFKRGLVVWNAPGVVDSDYVLETFVMIKNTTNKARRIYHGDAIAQAELCVNTAVDMGEFDSEDFESFVETVQEHSSRRGGFGSTGQ